jgi:hypothetical protein
MMSNVDALRVTFEESGHIAFECDPRSHDDGGWTCQFCAGGLFACTRCDSFEGAITTHCPGVRMTADQHDAVYAGTLDYRAGEWVEAGSPHTPNRGWDLHAACVEAGLIEEGS